MVDTKESKTTITLQDNIDNYFTASGNFSSAKFNKTLSGQLEGTVNSQNIVKLNTFIDNLLNELFERKMQNEAFEVIRLVTEITSLKEINSITVSTRFLTEVLKSPVTGENNKTERSSREEKKELIFDAALSVFETEGYRKATMDKIAEAAGIGKASVYRIFKNKEVLLDKLLLKHLSEIVNEVKEIHSSNDDILMIIKEMITYWVTYISSNPVIYHLIQTESNSHGISNKVIYYDFLTSSLPMFKEKILSQNRENRLKTLDFYSVFYGLLGYIDGIYIKWYRNGKNYDLKEEIPGLIEVLLNGVIGKK